MNRRKTAWIPIALLLIPALLFLFFTAWMSSAEYDPSSGAFSDRVLFPGGLSERLTETRFWSDLFNTLLLRLGTLIPGCALGWLLGLGIRKNASPLPRGAAVSLLSVFLFLPPQLLLSLPPLSLIGPLSVRCAAVLALPVFSLSLFCAAVFPDRHKKTAALLPLMTGLFFGLSPDLNAVLSAASSATGFGTLDAWAVGLMKNGAYTASAQVSLIKTVPECAAAVLAALLIGLMTSKPQDAPTVKSAGAKALEGTLIALVLSLLILVPSLLSLSSVSGVFASEAFRQSVIAAAVSVVIALIVSAALLMTMPRGKGMMCVLAAALTLLSAFVNLSYLLIGSMSHGFIATASELRMAVGSLAMLVVGAYLSFFMMGLITTVVERKHIHGRKLRIFTNLFTFPVFMLSYVPIGVIAFFKKVEWVPTRHDIAVNFDEVLSAGE